MKLTRSSLKSHFFAAALTLSVAASAVSAEAASITFSGSSGPLAATVKFEDIGTQLKVTLTNTSLMDVDDPVDILTAVFFNSTDLTLTRTSASLGGSAVFYGSANGGDVGGEWAYKTGPFAGVTQNSGISSAGFGLFGDTDRFPGSNLQGPDAPNGLQYGITSAGDNLATGNAAVTGGNALIQNSVEFLLNGWDAGDVRSAISSVRFQYGTALYEGDFTGITEIHAPEPASMVLTGTGLLAMARSIRRRKKA